MNGNVALRMTNISKSFGGVVVLRGVTFEVGVGEIHALLGENGAGKSVLMKTLLGVHQPDGGTYEVGGRSVRFRSPADAQRNRVSMVYQEFGLVQQMSVTENIFMDRLPTRCGMVQWGLARSRAAAVLGRLGSRISPDAIVGDLKIADQQEVEIARALSFDPIVFVMDEPTSSLSRVEIEKLHVLVRTLQRQGVSVIYITHKFEEVFALAQRATIMRDGSVVGSYPTSGLNPSAIVEKMTGKPMAANQARRQSRSDEENLLVVEGVSAGDMLQNVSLAVGKGTIVGVAGVIGAGKSELARAIVGALPRGIRVDGRIRMDGAPVDLAAATPARARSLGIGFVSEDRQAEGIVPEQSVLFNTVLPALARVTVAFALMHRMCRRIVQDIVEEVQLWPRNPDKPVGTLSGGNQQKVVIGKWIAAGSKLLILDEPTRGIDVVAREQIYELLRRQVRERGIGVLLLSSDLREILLASDRILVMCGGRITREVLPHETDEDALLDMVMGDRHAPPAGPPEHAVAQ